jgi:hypothetical protein
MNQTEWPGLLQFARMEWLGPFAFWGSVGKAQGADRHDILKGTSLANDFVE